MENKELNPIYLDVVSENVVDILAGSEETQDSYVVVQCSGVGGAACLEACKSGCKDTPKTGSCSKGCYDGCKSRK